MTKKKRRPSHPWTQEQDEWLKAHVVGKDGLTCKQAAAQISEIWNIDIPDSMVKTRLRKLGVKTGRTGRFEAGCIGTNKGKKMVYHSEESKQQARSNSFKAGHTPHNYMPGIGRERKTKDGYTFIRISDRRDIESRFNWMLKQRYVWEQANGPLPDGHVVIFLDGNRTNFDPDNLRAVPRGAVAIFNHKYGYTGDPALNRTNFYLAELEHKVNKKRKDRKDVINRNHQ